MVRNSIWSVLVSCCLLLPEQFVYSQDAPEKGGQSLDQQLLDDLGGDLFEGLDDLPLEDAVEKAKGTGKALDDTLLDQLGDGEDIGEEGDPLTKIANRMRAVEELIAEQKTAEQTQRIQQQIVMELTEMIQLVKKQCNGNSQNQQQQQQQQASKPKPGGKPGQQKQGNKPNNQAGNKASRESQMRDGKAEDAQVQREELEKMLKEVWGHLPVRVREQMQNAASEQFLSKYEELIENYYERLTQDTDAR